MPQVGLDNYELEYDSTNDNLVIRHRQTGNEFTINDGAAPIGDTDHTAVDHESGGALELTLGNLANMDAPAVLVDTAANRPAAGTADRLFIETDTDTVYRDDGAAWGVIATDTVDGNRDLQPEGAQTGLAADATGVQYEGQMRQQLDAHLLNSNRAVYLEAATASSAGDEDVAVELYDDTAAAVADSLTVSGGSPRARSADLSASLTAGNEIHVRYNVTTASATSGATFDAIGARLIVE